MTQISPKINAEKSEVTFTFKSRDLNGTIGGIRSQSSIDLNQLENSKIKGSVSVQSLDTGNFLRDGHLMWEKYFNEDDYPRINFESTTISANPDGSYTVQGQLSIKGIEKPVTFQAKRVEKNIKVTGSIYISDWGITIEDKRSENEVAVTMNLQLD
jgi:polyisoprenoid-binding protein YceI